MVYKLLSTIVIEGKLEAKLPTIRTDGKAQPREDIGDGEDQRWRKSEENKMPVREKVVSLSASQLISYLVSQLVS